MPPFFNRYSLLIEENDTGTYEETLYLMIETAERKYRETESVPGMMKLPTGRYIIGKLTSMVSWRRGRRQGSANRRLWLLALLARHYARNVS